MFLVMLVNVLYALVCPLGKVALNYSTPLFLTAFRMVSAGVLLLGFQYLFRRDKFTLSREYLWPLFLGSVFTIYLTNWLEFVGLDGLTPAKTAFLYNLYPFAAALLSYLYLKEKLNTMKWLGLAIGFLGSLPLLLGDTLPGESSVKLWGLVSISELAILGAIFTCPFGWIFIQRASCSSEYDSIMINGVTMLGGGIMAVVHSFLVESWTPLPISDGGMFLITSFGLIILSNIICNTLYIELLKKYSLTFLSFTYFISPFLTAIFDKLFFGYPITFHFYLSTFIMFVGFYLFYKEELKIFPSRA